jgi:hypothetical protein
MRIPRAPASQRVVRPVLLSAMAALLFNATPALGANNATNSPASTRGRALFDPRNYRAAVDGIYELDCVITAGSNIVNSASAAFTPSSVGKTIWVTSSFGIQLDQSTITAYVSPSQVTVSGVGRGAATGLPSFCAWGTDDTAAYIAAYNAGVSPTVQNTISVPGGFSLISSRFYDCTSGIPPNLIGLSGNYSTLLVSPNLTIPNDNSGALIRCACAGATFRDVTLFGPTSMYALSATQAVFELRSASFTIIDNVQMLQFGSPTANTYMLSVLGSTRLRMNRFSAYQASVYGIATSSLIIGARFNWASGIVQDIYASNIYQGVDVAAIVSRDGVGLNGRGGAMLNFQGGWLDECSNFANFYVHNGAEVNIDGMEVWTTATSGVSSAAVVVDGTSRAYIVNSALGPYSQGDHGPNYMGLIINTGGQVRASGTTFHNSKIANNLSIDNQGKFYDLGGNDCKNASAGGLLAAVPVPCNTAFTNPGTVMSGTFSGAQPSDTW